MKSLYPSLFLSFIALGLAGCGGFDGANLPAASVNPSQAHIGTISGNNFGGHAPLAGSHIYLVEAGNTGYGSAVKSLLTSAGGTTANGSWANAPDATDQFVPSSFYGLLADSSGAYSLTGDYTCDVGRVVYAVGYGGSPSFPANNPVILMSTSTATSSLDTVQSDGTHALYTYTTASTENFYIGESVAVTNFGNGSTGYNQTGSVADPGNASQTVTTGGTTYKPTLSTTQFSIYNTTSLAAGTYQVTAQSGVSPTPQVAGSPTFNPAAVNVAVLGVCPSTGTFANQISYIYMNEVSTVAWAYAFNQYANWAGTEQGTAPNANNEFYLGAPATTMAQQGLVNAAYVAANLYDIQGGNSSTTYAGEGHIARTQTPSGAGIVPQAELDTLGNILAACVDSNNTYRHSVGVISPQCRTLQQYAQDNGVYDTTTSAHQAFNNAQAILNIAHHPQGAGTGTTNTSGVQTVTAGTATSAAAFVNALYSLPTGNVPFTPNLTAQPNDFAVGINWQTSPYAMSGTKTGSTTNVTSVGEVGIDSLGNAFFPNTTTPDTQATAVTYELTPAGAYSTFAQTYYAGTGTTPTTGVAIDTSNNVFVSATRGVMEYHAPSYTSFDFGGDIGYVASTGYITQNSAQVAIDSSGYIYIANLNQGNPAGSASGSTATQLIKMVATPGTTTATFTINGGGTGANTATSCPSYMSYVTLDENNNIWTSNQNVTAAPYATVCQFSNSGTLQYSYIPTPGSATGIPRQIAIDTGNNAWFPDQGSNKLIEVASGATSASGSNGTASTFTASGVLNAPKGLAVDGNNTIWVTNSGNASLAQFSDTGTLLSPTYYVGTTGFNTVQNCSSNCTPSAQFAVIDQSGNLWSSDVAHGEVIEFIGIAAPTVQPLAQQRYGTANNTGSGIGQKP